MGSSWNGLDLFGSGPHRFAVGRRGQLMVNTFGGVPSPEFFALGLLPLEITVTGRLVASSEGELASLRGAIVDELDDPPTPGTLIAQSGLSWVQMSLVRFEETGPVDRGRTISVGYRAVFHRFA